MTGSSRGLVGRGLSLVEILVVLAILATLVGIAFPGFLRGQDRGQLREVVTGLREDLRHGRELAAASGGTRTIQFTTVGGDPAEEYYLLDSATGQEVRRRKLPPGFDVTETRLTFLESGGIARGSALPTPTTEGRICLEVHSPRSAVSVQVEVATGLIVE